MISKSEISVTFPAGHGEISPPPHIGDSHGDPQTNPQHADPHGLGAFLRENHTKKSMQFRVLWAGLRVAMSITHVGGGGGKFRHGLLAKSLKKSQVRSFPARNSGARNGRANSMGAWDFLVLSPGSPPMPIKFLVFLGRGVGFFLEGGGGSANFIFMGAGIFLTKNNAIVATLRSRKEWHQTMQITLQSCFEARPKSNITENIIPISEPDFPQDLGHSLPDSLCIYSTKTLCPETPDFVMESFVVKSLGLRSFPYRVLSWRTANKQPQWNEGKSPYLRHQYIQYFQTMFRAPPWEGETSRIGLRANDRSAPR